MIYGIKYGIMLKDIWVQESKIDSNVLNESDTEYYN